MFGVRVHGQNSDEIIQFYDKLYSSIEDLWNDLKEQLDIMEKKLLIDEWKAPT
jgi:hypothetical protein